MDGAAVNIASTLADWPGATLTWLGSKARRTPWLPSSSGATKDDDSLYVLAAVPMFLIVSLRVVTDGSSPANTSANPSSAMPPSVRTIVSPMALA